MRNPMTHVAPRLKNLGLGCIAALLLTSTLSGCGTRTSAEAVVVIDSSDATWILNDTTFGSAPNPSSLSPINPIVIHVFRSDVDKTPIPGAAVAIQVGGILVTNARLDDPISGTRLDDGAGLLLTHTDDRGVVKVLPVGDLQACPNAPLNGSTSGASQKVSGNLSIAVFVAAHGKTWNGNFSYNCVN